MQSLAQLMATLPQRGVIEWLGVRPAREVPMQTPAVVEARCGHGLTGDRFRGTRNKREVTFIQREHIDALGSLLGRSDIEAAVLRRNVVVSGLNLLALKGRRFAVGDALFECTGFAHPCSRMEIVLGPGGYNAMRGHGGITARILRGGLLRIGESVSLLPDRPNSQEDSHESF